MDTIKNINSEGIDIMENLNSALIFLFGNENLKILHALIVLTILDYITGVCVAIKMGRISSAIGAKGIAGKVIIYALIYLSNIFDTYFHTANGILEAATILFYCANEAISILENAYKMGIPIPQKLKETLDLFKKEKG